MNFLILFLAFAGMVVVGGLLLWLTNTSAILKDQLIPQIPPGLQSYSLARNQMAFWFLIIFGSFIWLFLTQHTTDVVTTQALTLMGISVVTAGGAALVDNYQDTPEDALNDGLKALGLSNYQDVQALEGQIAALSAQGDTLTVAGKATLNDKMLLLQTYKNRIAPFLTQGWFRDLTTDVDGTALHRFQALVWTAVLGVIFIYQTYQGHAMPQFSDNLLALMGVSNAGYVGFKINETQY